MSILLIGNYIHCVIKITLESEVIKHINRKDFLSIKWENGLKKNLKILEVLEGGLTLAYAFNKLKLKADQIGELKSLHKKQKRQSR